MAATAGLFRKLARGPVRPDDRLAGAVALGAHDRGDAGARFASAWPTRAKVRGGSTPTASTHRACTCTPCERVRRVAAAFGARMPEPQFDLPISADDTRWAAETLEALPIATNRVEPWGTVADETLAPRALRRIARRAVARYRAGLIAVGSAADRPLVRPS